MILSVGEILVDIFEDENSKTVFPGGAPFNVVSNALSFGANTSFYGCVGNDEYGQFLVKFIKGKKFSETFINVLADKETTQALVSLKNGERSFKFVRENGADYCFDLNKFKELDFNKYKIIHFGSLMLSEEKGRSFLYFSIKHLRENYPNVLLSFDVNYRDDIFDNQLFAIATYREFIKLFDIVKISNDEVEILSQGKNEENAFKNILSPKQFVFYSLGKEGSMMEHNGQRYFSKTKVVQPVDTTGAGDAFYSYVLSQMDKYDFEKLSKEQIEKILYEANCVGALATLKKGAIDVVPSEKELFDFVN